MDKLTKGKKGEGFALDYLRKRDFLILETNYRNKIGEIDIIAIEGEVLVFIEVKSRTSTSFGRAYEAVNFHKQRKIINTSLIYLRDKGLNDFQLRYDIIEVYMTNRLKINHIKDAFCL